MEEQKLTDDQKKSIRDIVVPVLVAGFSTLFTELSKWIVHELKENYARTRKREDGVKKEEKDSKSDE